MPLNGMLPTPPVPPPGFPLMTPMDFAAMQAAAAAAAAGAGFPPFYGGALVAFQMGTGNKRQ